MKNIEASDRFDILYNNIMSNAAPGLNEYEKSVFLTKAQDEIVKNYFNPQGNKYKEGFDGSAKRQMDFSMLIEVATPSKSTSDIVKMDSRSTVYVLDDDIFAIINESVELSVSSDDTRTVKGVRQVIPISYEEYVRLMSKPFKEPLKNQAWRLITAQSGDSAIAEVILNNVDRASSYDKEYKVRYVRRPYPIILVDLTTSYGDSYINGKQVPLYGADGEMSELDESLHEEILQRAVELAKASYASDQSGQVQFQNQVTVGQRSE